MCSFDKLPLYYRFIINIIFQPTFIMRRENHQLQRIMRDCMLLRNHNCTSYIQLQIYFQFMHQTILQKDNIFRCSSKQTSKQFFHKQFFKAFEKFSQLQAAKYYLHMLQIVHTYVNCPKVKSGHTNSSTIVQNHSPRSGQFAVDIIKKGFFNNTEKNHYLQIDKKKAILLLKSQNNPYDLEINLENYLVRESCSNEKGKAHKQFLVIKAGAQSTPDEIRFAMKDVYEFPVFYGDLWNFILQLHANRLKTIIDKLSQGGSKKGYVEIILLQSQNHFALLQSERKQLKLQVDEHKSVEQYEYLDTNHPEGRVSQEICTKMGAKEQSGPGHFVWGNQWVKLPNGHLKNVNFEYISVQRSAVKKVIKTFMSMGNGQSDMPIEIFSNESNLHQLARSCKYFSHFFDNTSERFHQTQTIVIDAFKKNFCSIIGFLLIRNRMEKPIQPFLGQTYQGFIDGYPITLQEIAKNQSYILFETSEIKLYGCLELKTGITGLNSILAGSKGFLTLQLIKYKKSPKIMFTIPMIELSGLLYGNRLVQINDTSVIYEEQNRRLCCLNWGKNKKAQNIKKEIRERQDFVQGEIIQLNQDKNFQISNFIENKQYVKEFLKDKFIQKVYGELYGNWTQEIFFSDQKNIVKSLFKIDEQKPGDLYHYVQPLPSDCRSRKDIRLLDYDKITQAETERKKAGQIEQKQQKMRTSNKKK